MFMGVMDVGNQRQLMGAQKGKWWGQKKASGGGNKGQVVGAKTDK